jgi:hypothetical protein
MAQTLTLQGNITITENGEYYFVLPSNGTSTQVGFTLQNEEVYIYVENLEKVLISLPLISAFNGGWNCKIYIVSKGSTTVTTTKPDEGQPRNYINYFDETTVINGSTAYFHISNSENYACWITDGGFRPPSANVLVTLAYDNLDFLGYQEGDVVRLLPKLLLEPQRYYSVVKVDEFKRPTLYELGSYEGSDVSIIEVGRGFILNNEDGTQSTVLTVST